MPLRGVGPLSGGYGVPIFESRTQSIPPTTQNAGRHFSKYRETPHSGQGCGVRKKNHDSHFLLTELTYIRSHIGLYVGWPLAKKYSHLLTYKFVYHTHSVVTLGVPRRPYKRHGRTREDTGPVTYGIYLI